MLGTRFFAKIQWNDISRHGLNTAQLLLKDAAGPIFYLCQYLSRPKPGAHLPRESPSEYRYWGSEETTDAQWRWKGVAWQSFFLDRGHSSYVLPVCCLCAAYVLPWWCRGLARCLRFWRGPEGGSLVIRDYLWLPMITCWCWYWVVSIVARILQGQVDLGSVCPESLASLDPRYLRCEGFLK